MIADGFDAFNCGVFTIIGKFYWECTMKGICLVSAPHSPSACGSTVSLASDGRSFVRHELNSRQSKNLSLVKSLRVRIIKTSGSSVPALASVDAWGYLAYSCPAPLARTILSKWRSIIKQLQDQQQPVYASTAAGATTAAAVDGAHLHRGEQNTGNKEATSPHQHAAERRPSLPADDFQIPEEFLDGLTFEIMALPVRLPSGNVIDERTLERFTEQEAAWGRSPSDPFTSQLITDTRRPLYDTSLKQRIDAFLLSESHRPCLRNVPRTVGPTQQRSWQLPQRSTPRPVHQPPPPPPQRLPLASTTAPPKTTSSDDPSRRWLSALAGTMQQLAPRSAVVRAVALSTNTTNKLNSLSSSSSHVTAAAPLCPSGANGTVANDRPAVFIYSLPCSHRVCRTCLLDCKNRNDLICPDCRSPFALDQPVLCHKF